MFLYYFDLPKKSIKLFKQKYHQSINQSIRMDQVTIEQKIEFLISFLSEHRRKKFYDVLNKRTKYITVVLEDIYDPHNGSACIRSCEANGIQNLYIIERSNKFALKEGTAMSAGKWINLILFNSKIKDPSLECFEHLKNLGYSLYGMTPYPIKEKNCISLENVEIETPIALIFGSEKSGLSEISKKYLQNFLYIPMYGFMESYNISVACAISVYTLRTKLNSSNIEWHLPDSDKKEILCNWLKKEFPNIGI
ncbi:MAG: TrmH family RNA methyltransferase [Leptonema sp. (in: bacteria)]